MTDFVHELSTPQGALKLFRRYSVAASDGTKPATGETFGKGLSHADKGGLEAPLHRRKVAKGDAVVNVELRKPLSNTERNKLQNEHYTRFMAQKEGGLNSFQKVLWNIDAYKNKKTTKWVGESNTAWRAVQEGLGPSPDPGRGLEVLYTHFHDAPSGLTTPMYFLPWDPEGGAVQLTIPSRDAKLSAQKHPHIFLTAALSGCSIFISGTPSKPTIYHCGTEGMTDPKRSAADFWKDAMTQLGVSPKKVSAIHNVDYITPVKHDDGKVLKRDQDIKDQLNKHYKAHAKQSLKIESTKGWGAVFGIREGSDWKFYLQENVTITYYQIGTSEKGDVVPLTQPRTVSRPAVVRQIFPGGGGVGRVMESWRTLRFT